MLGVFDLLNKSWEVYKDRFETIIGITAIQVVGTFIFSLLGIVLALLIGFSFSSLRIASHFTLLGWGQWILFIMIAGLPVFLFNVWTTLALIFAVADREEEIGLGDCFGRAWNKFISGIWIDILRGLVVFLGFVLLIIPGIIFAVWFALSKYILVAEDKKGSKAMKRSKSLVEGHWWEVLGRYLSIILLSFVVSVVFGFVPIIGQLAASLLLPPFLTTFSLLIYENLKQEPEKEIESEPERL